MIPPRALSCGEATMSAVAAWLGEHGFGQYATVFADQAVDVAILPDLNDVDLEKLGVRLGHRKRMLKAIAALKSDCAGETSASPERRQITVLFCDLVGSTAL